MSVLLPLILSENRCTMRPSHIMDQQFGLGLDLDDLLLSIFADRRPNRDSRPKQAEATRTEATGGTSDTMEQQFGSNLEDLLTSIFAIGRPNDDSRPSQVEATPKADVPTEAQPSAAAAMGNNNTDSTVSNHINKFQVHLDVQDFTPEEITVKVTGDNTVTVEGKHEEKEDEHGSVLRHFIRRYTLPDGHDINNVVSNLSSDGILSITAPVVNQEKDEHRTITVQQTGVPSKPLEN